MHPLKAIQLILLLEFNLDHIEVNLKLLDGFHRSGQEHISED